MCQPKELGGRRCQGALRRQRNKAAKETAQKKAEDTGFASMSLIASPKSFQEYVENKLVMKTSHPEFPELSIYCYSQQTQYKNQWDDITVESRGLIVNNETGEIVARPFEKFFNYGQDVDGITDFPKDGKIEVMEKADGSLGIMYQRPDGKTSIATKGSMKSEQAIKASQMYDEKYEGKWDPDPDYTYCFETIYPDNRVVINYGDTEDLMLLGARHKATGRSMSQEELDNSGWPGPRPKVHAYSNLGEVLEAQDKGITGEEGFVVNFVDHDKKVKFKFQEYLELHRNASNLSVNRVYDAYKEGINLKESVPDEFYEDVEKTTNYYDREVSKKQRAIDEQYDEITKNLPENYTQKEFAQRAFSGTETRAGIAPRQMAKYILNKHKGLDNRKSLVDSLKPYGNVSFASFFKEIGEDENDNR